MPERNLRKEKSVQTMPRTDETRQRKRKSEYENEKKEKRRGDESAVQNQNYTRKLIRVFVWSPIEN